MSGGPVSGGSPLRPARSPWADAWALDPAIVFLNHGSFGACPRAVLEAQDRLRAELEANPVEFLGRSFEARVDEARSALAAFVGARPADLVFVPNATHGIATVLRSLRLAPGDEILATDHEYNAALNMAREVAAAAGAALALVRLPLPWGSPAEVLERILGAIGPRTRLLLVSHVTSPTALVSCRSPRSSGRPRRGRSPSSSTAPTHRGCCRSTSTASGQASTRATSTSGPAAPGAPPSSTSGPTGSPGSGRSR